MKHSAVCTLLIAIGALGAGCVSTGKVTPRPPEATTRVLAFGGPLVVSRDFIVEDPTDPRQLVEFGLMLADKGLHARAAAFFAEASEAPSPTNDLAIACLLAAANEHLQAGNIAEFRATAALAKSKMTQFQMASMDRNSAVLLALAEIGEHPDSIPDESTPFGLRELFGATQE